MRRRFKNLSGAQVVASIVAVAALIVSYVALYEEAVRFGTPPALAILMPVILDGAMISSGILSFRWMSKGWSARGPIAVMFISLIFSVVVNVSHASDTGTLGMLLAAMPPIVLLIVTELTIADYRKSALERSELIAAREAAELEAASERKRLAAAKREARKSDTEKRATELVDEPVAEQQQQQQTAPSENLHVVNEQPNREERVREALAAHPNASLRTLSEVTGVPASTVNRIKKALEAAA